ncbi:MAG: DUF2892 domain-containing protein [Rubellimicrobium sp.]|nr:DUF2892 domain-containing protein [Rubellimicrobium sp.]
MFETNVGNTDRIIRIAVGVLLILAFFMTSGSWSWLYLLVGAIVLATGVMRSCLLYKVLGYSTNQGDKS